MAFARMEEFVREEVLPSWFTNRLQDRLGSLTNVRLRRATATTIEVPAGADDDRAVLNIEGRWRFNAATVQRAAGGAAGTYAIFAVAAANDIRNAPDPYSDFTNYAWDLRIVPDGQEPPLQAGVVDIRRRIGRLVWDGAAITQLVQEVGVVAAAQLAGDALYVSTQDAAVPPLTVRGVAAQTAPLVQAGVNANDDRLSLTSAGKLRLPVQGSGAGLELGGDANLYRSAADTLKTDDSLHVVGDFIVRQGHVSQVRVGTYGPSGLPGMDFGSAGDTNLYRNAANDLKTDDIFRSAQDLVARDQGASQMIVGFVPGGFPGLLFGVGGDTNLYRAGANLIATDDAMQIGNYLALAGALMPGAGRPRLGLQGLPGGAGVIEGWDRLSLSGSHAFGSFPDPGGGGLALTGAVVFAGDTNLYRSGVNILRTDDSFDAGGYVVAGSHIYVGTNAGELKFGLAADTNLRRPAAGVLATDGIFQFGGDSSGLAVVPAPGGVNKAGFQWADGTGWYVSLGPRAGGNAGYEALRIYDMGKLEWGGDTSLYRAGADSLATADDLYARHNTAQQIVLASSSGFPMILFGSGNDTNLYRSAADRLATDDDFQINSTSRRLYLGTTPNALGGGTWHGIQMFGAATTKGIYLGSTNYAIKYEQPGDVGYAVFRADDGSSAETLRIGRGQIGFLGAADQPRSTGWGAALATNFPGAVARTSLTSAYTMNDLRDVVATVVNVLRNFGLFGA